MNDVFPFDSTTEMKLGLASVDSGASVIVLVVVPVNDTCWLIGFVGGGEVGDDGWPVGLPDDEWSVGLAAPVFTTALDFELEPDLTTASDGFAEEDELRASP